MKVEEIENSNRSPRHVLVVDDEAFIRNAFKLYLETHGFLVSSAAGGEQALEVFRDETRPVDLILLDLVMPGFQGLELLRQFKAEHSLVEVIIATGCGSMNSAIEALRLGAFDYITKPIVDFDRDLLTVVEKALANRQHKLDQISAVRDEAREESSAGRFYINMESLAASLAHSTTRESALGIVESFFEQHFATTGGVVSEHSSESMSFHNGWGAFSDAEEEGFVPPETTEIGFWRPLLRSTSRWEEIGPEVSLPPALRVGAGKDEPLEVLRIPLEPATAANGRSTSLFVFRVRCENAPPPPPQTALLALVVNAALSRSTASVAVH